MLEIIMDLVVIIGAIVAFVHGEISADTLFIVMVLSTGLEKIARKKGEKK